MTEILEPNEPLLRKTLEHIQHHPEHWDQLAYRHFLYPEGVKIRKTINPAIECGTAMCFAGWACDISGVTWRDHTTSAILDEHGQIKSANDEARDLLGLTDRQAVALFDTGNTIADLERIVDDIIEGRPTKSGFELRGVW